MFQVKPNGVLAALLLTLLIVPTSVFAKYTIQSSVAPEYANGLHKKYLTYLAEKMDMHLTIAPMPFARRVKALRTGQIDIMVGLQEGHAENNEFVYIQPSYESLSHGIFVKRHSNIKLEREVDMLPLTIAVTRHAQYFESLLNVPKSNIVEVSAIDQKINMLNKQRVDAFIHFKESILPIIKANQLTEHIVLAKYQPVSSQRYFFAVSKHSGLFLLLEELRDCIKQGIKDGDFKKIRSEHYQDITIELAQLD